MCMFGKEGRGAERSGAECYLLDEPELEKLI
jgi:hypothetical protein